MQWRPNITQNHENIQERNVQMFSVLLLLFHNKILLPALNIFLCSNSWLNRNGEERSSSDDDIGGFKTTYHHLYQCQSIWFHILYSIISIQNSKIWKDDNYQNILVLGPRLRTGTQATQGSEIKIFYTPQSSHSKEGTRSSPDWRHTWDQPGGKNQKKRNIILRSGSPKWLRTKWLSSEGYVRWGEVISWAEQVLQYTYMLLVA